MREMLSARVFPDQGECFLVTATSRDIYAWEKAGRGRSMKEIGERKFDALYPVMHAAAKRQGLYHGSFDEFVATCDLDFDVSPPDEEEEDSSVPTSGGASDSD